METSVNVKFAGCQPATQQTTSLRYIVRVDANWFKVEGAFAMFRRNLIPLLLDHPMSLSQIARAVGEKPKEITEALTHLTQSLRHSEYYLVVEPAECRRCGFEFGSDKLNRPSKCPNCKGTWIAEPLFSVVTRATS